MLLPLSKKYKSVSSLHADRYSTNVAHETPQNTDKVLKFNLRAYNKTLKRSINMPNELTVNIPFKNTKVTEKVLAG